AAGAAAGLTGLVELPTGPLIGCRFDRLHVRIREAEVVADLVDQNVGDDGPERLVVLGPVVEDGPAIEKDRIRHASTLRGRNVGRQADTGEEAKKIERTLDAEFGKHIFVWE